MEYEVRHLPQKQWKGYVLDMDYVANEYYDVIEEKFSYGWNIRIEKKVTESPLPYLCSDYDYPDKLYNDYWEGACAWGVMEGDKLIGAIETCPEEWSNRLMITELWVDRNYRRRGIGRVLMDVAKEQAKIERRRALYLETQSKNVNAIDFYISQGFDIKGYDNCCYKNNDIDRKEVRIDMVYMLNRKKINLDDIIIREEIPADYHETERVAQLAFWNKHHRGCDEHLLVKKLRQCDAYLPQYSRIAVLDGKIVGAIIYSKAYVMDGTKRNEIVTFGPLCVLPEYQGIGIGGKLLKYTIEMLKKDRHSGIVIFGEPDYYPLYGFRTCDNYGITTSSGKNCDAFMAYKLNDSFDKVKGKFYESEIFENLPKEEVDEYSKKFPPLYKQYFPKQWD